MSSYATNRLNPLQQAVRVIEDTYGVKVSIEKKAKNLLKFGESTQVQTTETTLMTNQTGIYNETYVRRNLITHYASGSTSDVGQVAFEGHKVGDDISVSTLTQAAGLATCTTATAHGFATDEWVYIEGANETEYNGIVQVTVTSTTECTFSVDSGAASPATGTITATSQNKTFISQTVTLAGQTKSPLTTPLARCTRGYNPQQDRAVDYVAPIYVGQDVTFTSGAPTAVATHLMIPLGKNQSRKASTSISSTDWWIITSIQAHMFTKQNSWADVGIKIREEGGVFREADSVAVSSDSPNGIIEFNPPLIAPANSDVILVGRADSNGRDVGGSIEGYLAKTI